MRARSLIYSFVVLIVLALASIPVSAQVAINLEINHQSYLKYEPVYCRLTLVNRSGHALVFGESTKLSGKLTFEIEMPSGGFAMLKDPKATPSTEGLILKSGATETFNVRLSDYYSLFEVGRYRVRAILSHRQLPEKYQSNLVVFSVYNGLTVWERIVGVPDVINKDPNKKIKSRTYKILSGHDGKRKVFFLVVEDDKLVYAVRRIGYEIGGSAPTCAIDALSRVHILVKQSGKVFKYFRYNVTGKLEDSGVYVKNSSTSPYLVANPKDGKISVQGGRKARPGVDYLEDKELPLHLK